MGMALLKTALPITKLTLEGSRHNSRFSYNFFLLAQQPQVDQGILIHEASRSHTTTHHSR